MLLPPPKGSGFPQPNRIYENKHGTFIIRVEGHLTCVQDGRIKDIWDCGKEIIDIVWKVNR